MRQAESAADALGVLPAVARDAGGLAAAFAALAGRADAAYVCAAPLVNTNRALVGASALAAGLPSVHGFREAVEAGSLMSYGPNFPALFRRAADFVDRILRGARPGEIPVEQPTQFDLAVNLAAARSLGVAVPPSVLARADEVIE